MSSSAPRRGLRGRRGECGALDRLAASAGGSESGAGAARRGGSRQVRPAGVPGATSATGCRIVRAAGVESEMELAFAGLHQLCAPMLEQLERLPGPQRDALADGVRPERGERAGPVPGRVWPCSACWPRPPRSSRSSAWWTMRSGWIGPPRRRSAFVARRLLAEPVALVFAVREPSDGAAMLAGCRSCVIGGLRDDDARALLDSVVPGRLDERVRDRIVAETRGNPLALLELPRGLTRGGAGRRVRACPTRGRWRAGSSRASSGGSGRFRPTTQRLLLVGRGRAGGRRRRCCGGRPSGSASARTPRRRPRRRG